MHCGFSHQPCPSESEGPEESSAHVQCPMSSDIIVPPGSVTDDEVPYAVSRSGSAPDSGRRVACEISTRDVDFTAFPASRSCLIYGVVPKRLVQVGEFSMLLDCFIMFHQKM